jgi:DNA helicase-2/ATP-dependent DNA helicase PcrA
VDRAGVLEGLDESQREAVTNPGGPLAVVAPAGSGKTRVLTRRIAWRVLDGTADASHVLAITFTRRAADELVERLTRLELRDRPTAGTFHGVAWSLLRRRWTDLGVRNQPGLLTEPERLLAASSGGRAANRSLSDAALEIGWAHARLIPPDRYQAEATRYGRHPPGGAATMAETYAAYETAKRAHRLIDFDDLLGRLVHEIKSDASFAEVVRWRFRHLFVDEFQDINRLQHALLDAIRGGRPDLCVVGDPNQAIYEWNGADPGWINEFAQHHPGATVVRLRASYRSSPEILALSHAVLPSDDAGTPEVQPVRPEGGAPTVHSFADEHAEAAGIAAILRSERIPGRRWSACAVLVRTHAQAVLIERALVSADIPTRRRGGQPLLEATDVRRALADAGAVPEPGAVRSLIDDITNDDDGPRSPHLLTLASLAREFLATDRDATVESFRIWLALGTGGDDGTSYDAVDVVTFHSAKGLEWPIVVVAGLEKGLVPHAAASSRGARGEEARLLHVALTRAEHTLHLTWARRRNRVNRSPSSLLPLLVHPAPDDAAPPPPELRRPAMPSDRLDRALRSWRRAAAMAAGLPEQAICTDRALAAVASARPSTVAELAALPEVGPIAARRLGPRLLATVASARDVVDVDHDGSVVGGL